MELSERKLKILQAIISDYIKTAEPVGSRTLSKKEGFDYSPATIRNEMADLEEMGYPTHPQGVFLRTRLTGFTSMSLWIDRNSARMRRLS